jgi:branched-chain amino acid transport system permease protein
MSEWVTFYLSLGVLVLSVLIMRSLRNKRPGRVIIGTRDNDRAADAFGVPTTKVKVQTFALSGAIAGLAGSLYMVVSAQSGIGSGTFQPAMSIAVFSFATIGGLGSIAGAVSGVALFRILDFVIGKNVQGAGGDLLRLSLSGGGLLFILYFLPGGLWQLVQRVRDRYLRAIAGRRGILVPSLLADSRVEVPPTEPVPEPDDPTLVMDLGAEADDDHAEDESELIGGALR